MDGIVALLLSKKFTKDTVIGMGAIKGAACQVQSINKAGKTTTITLKWEDNVGVVHTQAFDVEDGLDGVSVSNATIKPNGHLELTLSDGNTIDCGKVLPQYDTIPTPSSSNEGQILQYIGTTTSNYTNGYFYECINDGGTYKWVEKSVQDSYTKIEIGDIQNLPDNTKDVIQNINSLKLSIDQLQASKLSISDIDNALSNTSENPVQNKVIKLTIDQLRGSILDKLDEKEDKFRYSIMPTASVDYLNKIVEYIGATDSTYTNGYFYQCRFDGINYSWVQKNIQPSSGGTGGDGVVDGYYNSTDHLFYEENTFINPITGDDNTLYVSLDTNLLYRYNGLIFIRVDESSSGEDDVINGYYNTTDGKFYEDSTYTTEIVGQTGKIYISIDTNIQYRWDSISIPNKFVAMSIKVDDTLSDTSENPVQNKVIKVELDKLSASMLSASMKEKVINLKPIYLIGSGLNLNEITGELTASGIDVPIDDHLSDTSINPVQNKVITVPLQALQGSVLTKMQKMLSAQQDNFAVFDNNGQVIDSNISKDIVPSNASSSNKLLVKSDIDNALSDTSENPVQNKVITVPLQALQGSMADKANKVTSATNGDIATLDANGDLTDSGFSKDIIPNTATTSNKLATNSDLPIELNDLSDDVVITNPQNNQIFAYNGTSGKWENKTGQETIGGLVFKGSILFANLPTTGMTNGDAYDIKDAFTTDSRFEEGIGIECGAGTDIVWVTDENKWNILTPSGVYSFNGRAGAVTPATSDYDADQIDYDNTTSGLIATNVQDGVDELSSEKADKVSSATSGHLAGLDGNGNLTDSGVVASNVIEKVTTATGLLKDDGSVDTTTYAPSNKAYLTDDTTETTIDNADYIPFYDSSVPAKRKSTWENIKSVLKTYFDTIYATINNLKNYVSWESANKFVGKNLLENHAVSTTTPIYGTLMYTVDSNGVITGSGTSNSNDSTFWIWGDGWGISHTIPIEKTRLEIGKTYTLYSGNNSTNAGVIFYFYNGDTFISSASTWTGTGKIDMTVPANTTHICAILRVRNGATIDNDKFYPMITYQDVPITLPNDYEPYIYDNTQVMSYVDNGILGAKNRLPLTLENLKNWNTGGTWSDNVFTHTNGVTYTVTTDNAGNVKNISVNGSPSVVTTFTVGELTGLSGNWILNGIIGGSQSTYGIQLYDKTSATWTSQYSVDGDAIVNLEDSTHNYRFAFFVRNDVTVSNISIKPMLRLITDTDSTYQPYAMTNAELTKCVTWKDV